MNAIELWMKWQAEGTPVPMAVCELAAFWGSLTCGTMVRSDGTATSYDGGDVHRIDVMILPHGMRATYGMTFTRYAPDLLRQWAYYATKRIVPDGVATSWRSLLQRVIADPETLAWAKEWRP